MASDRYARDAAHGGPDDTGPDPLNQNAIGGDRTTDLPEEPAPGGPIGGRRGADEGPISERVGRDPGNLGGDVPAASDVVHPAPDAGDGDDPGAGQM